MTKSSQSIHARVSPRQACVVIPACWRVPASGVYISLEERGPLPYYVFLDPVSFASIPNPRDNAYPSSMWGVMEGGKHDTVPFDLIPRQAEKQVDIHKFVATETPWAAAEVERRIERHFWSLDQYWDVGLMFSFYFYWKV
jgi:hypothetical protein